MFILSPKSNFLGGSLVSASHLGRLFPGRLFVWKNKSPLLDSNKVEYTVIDRELYPSTCGDQIWVNDTCVDSGYYPQSHEENQELLECISNFNNIILVNHQPINRCTEYLDWFIGHLIRRGCKVTLLNYRAWWNIEWQNELAIKYPTVKVYTSPYHYYLPYVDSEVNPSKDRNTKVALIGRSNSKCKVHAQCAEIQRIIPGHPIHQIFPDPNISNTEFLKLLGNYQYILTGYYYGGEGTLELNVPYNKLEWSFIDAMLAGVIPITNDLFSDELTRLGIEAIQIDYDYLHHNDKRFNSLIHMDYCKLNFSDYFEESRNRLINELKKGNKLTSMILGEPLYQG